MFHATNRWRRVTIVLRVIALLVAAWCCAWFAARAHAQPSIDLSLNVLYTNPLNAANSGGTWQVVAKSSSDTSGIAGLKLFLTGVNLPVPQAVGPRGRVNGTDPAGFSEYVPYVPTAGVVSIVTGQAPIPSLYLGPGEEQSVFYGVGRLANGAPGMMGPPLSSLTNAQAIPWATGDPLQDAAWNTAARLASGTFNAGSTPAFFDVPGYRNGGTVFTSLGTSTTVGNRFTVELVTTIVRTNESPLPDYNGNGVVDAADYTVWRNTLGQVGVGLAADGNRNGTVDPPDYDFWKANFGAIVPGAGSGSQQGTLGLGGSAVPEPASGTLLAGAAVVLFLRPKTRVLRNVLAL